MITQTIDEEAFFLFLNSTKWICGLDWKVICQNITVTLADLKSPTPPPPPNGMVYVYSDYFNDIE